MNESQERSGASSAAVTLLVTFVATLVLHTAVMLAYLAIGRNGLHVPYLERIVGLFPFIPMTYPGLRWLLLRRWVIGVVLLIGGWLLAFPVLWFALGVGWKVFG
jgi:hypothetical protein